MKSLLFAAAAFALGLPMTMGIQALASGPHYLAEYAVAEEQGQIGMVSGTTRIFVRETKCTEATASSCLSMEACGQTVWVSPSQRDKLKTYLRASASHALGFRQDGDHRFCVLQS